jgi:hypothetical protein
MFLNETDSIALVSKQLSDFLFEVYKQLLYYWYMLTLQNMPLGRFKKIWKDWK